MFEDLFCITIYFFTIYGILSLIISAVNSIRQRGKIGNPRIKLVLIMKNQEDTVEGIVRNILSGNFSRGTMPEVRLTVVDLGSTDKTYDILVKLKRDYEYMDVLSNDERERIFTYFDENS